MSTLAIFLAMTLAFWLWPSGRSERVILLPQPDGRASAVTVKTATGHELVLDRPYAVAVVTAGGKSLNAETTTAAAVQAQYGDLLRSQPMRPVSFVVHFVTGLTELTPDSLPVLQQVEAELSRRPAPQVTIIGHTDAQGANTSTNDSLSLSRAQRVKTLLIDAGIKVEEAEVTGRGAREPIQPEVAAASAAANRRVEINIR